MPLSFASTHGIAKTLSLTKKAFTERKISFPLALFFVRKGLYCFLFLRVLRCFNSPRSQSHAGSLRVYRNRKSHSAISGSKTPCVYPEHIAAWHDLPRRLSRAIPQMAFAALSVQIAYGNFTGTEFLSPCQLIFSNQLAKVDRMGYPIG